MTDIETGPDGFLYILTFERGTDDEGAICGVRPIS
jgi:hypothetical protein